MQNATGQRRKNFGDGSRDFRAAKTSTSIKDEGYTDSDLTIDYLNQSLSTTDESPIGKKRMHAPGYCQKNGKVTTNLCKG